MRALPPQLVESVARRGEGLTLLVIRLGALGDILRTLPAVRLVRRALDRARIFWVLDDRWTVALEGHPDLDGCIALPRREWRSQSGVPWRWPALLRAVSAFGTRLRSLDPGLVLDFHGNLRSGIVGRLSGAPVRIGYSGHQQKEGNRLLTTHHVPSGSRRTPRMERNLDLVRALGIADHPLPTGDLPLADRGTESAGGVLRELGIDGGPFAVVCPGVSRAQSHKKPPVALLSAACRTLSSRGVTPILVWGPGEEEDAARVMAQPESGALLAPPTDLATLAALLQRARLYVGGDTGPLHMACSVGCPVVALYGPTDPEVNRPWAVPYRTVSPPGRVYTGVKRHDRRSGGFSGLESRHVEEAVSSILAGS